MVVVVVVVVAAAAVVVVVVVVVVGGGGGERGRGGVDLVAKCRAKYELTKFNFFLFLIPMIYVRKCILCVRYKNYILQKTERLVRF